MNSKSFRTKCRTIFLILSLLAVNTLSAQDLYIIPDTFPEQPLDAYLWVLEDSSRTINAEEILADTGEVRFQFQPLASLPKPLQPESRYWGKIVIKSQVSILDWQLLFKGDGLEGAGWQRGNGTVKVMTYQDSNILHSEITGADVPAREKAIPKNWNINKVPFSIEEGQQKQLLISVEGNNFGFPPFFGLTLQKPPEDRRFFGFFSSVDFEGYIIYVSIVFGIVLMALLYHVILFLYLREPVYGWFSLWLVFPLLSASIGHPKGFIAEYVISNQPLLNVYLWSIVASLVWVVFWQFGRVFVRTKAKFPRLDLVIRILMGVLIIDILIELFFQYFLAGETFSGRMRSLVQALFYTILGLANIAGIVLALFLLFKKDLAARYFGAGALIATIGTLLGSLWATGIISLPFDPFITSILLQIFIYSFGLAYRRQLETKEKAAVEQKLLQNEKERVEQFARVDKLKDQFLANTSHELRTPLNGIIGLSESLLETTKEDARREDLNLIISSGKRLANLVNDILDFSKLRNQEIELQQKNIGLRSLVNVVLRNNQPLLAGKSLELINEVPPDLPLIRADENRLQQIFYNLIGNAIKFTEKGHIRVTAQPLSQKSVLAPDMIQITVEDTGIGIPENKRAVIFQEFEQADGSIAREFAGTGLGLSISKKMVELHGGKMWVSSEIGRGSQFFFTLPVSKELTPNSTSPTSTMRPELFSSEEDSTSKTNSTKAEENAPIISPNSASLHLLVVDDEPINQKVLRNQLSSLYKITSAMNGEEALQLLEREEKFDLVLLDVMMPRMSGYEVCQRIRQKYLPNELPIIMVTAKNQIMDLVEGLETGANDYVTKPFSKDEFLARIRTHLDLHRINQVTNRFVPTDFIRSLGKKRLTELRLGDQVEHEVTVFFSDIRSYTSISENMSPAENFSFVNAYVGEMGPIIRARQGFVHQYLGDGIMAIFKQGPDAALRAAIEMQEKLEESDHQIKVGMGLHTGKLIMGIIGDDHRMDPATISDTVNTAARMEGLTKVFGSSILLSESTYRLLSNPTSFNLRFLGKVQVKGKEQALGIYECLDGLAPERRRLALQTKEIFSRALEAFYRKDFVGASASFKKVLAENPDDIAAARFLARSARYMVDGVAEGWTGVEMMQEK